MTSENNGSITLPEIFQREEELDLKGKGLSWLSNIGGRAFA